MAPLSRRRRVESSRARAVSSSFVFSGVRVLPVHTVCNGAPVCPMCHYIDNIRTIKCVFYFLEPLRWDIAWLGFLFEVDALLFAPDDVIRWRCRGWRHIENCDCRIRGLISFGADKSAFTLTQIPISLECTLITFFDVGLSGPALGANASDGVGFLRW